jgi:hypothetical protein
MFQDRNMDLCQSALFSRISVVFCLQACELIEGLVPETIRNGGSCAGIRFFTYHSCSHSVFSVQNMSARSETLLILIMYKNGAKKLILVHL